MIGVLALVRDEEASLSRFFAEMEKLEEALQEEVVYSFYENDSQDNSPSMVIQWLRKESRRGGLVSETLGLARYKERERQRTQLLAMARNVTLSQVKMFAPDTLVVIDVDIDFSYQHILALLPELNNPQVAMACAATMQNCPSVFRDSDVSYYDSWAFIANDGSAGLVFAYCPSTLKADQEQWRAEQRITALSAFGGIAVLRYEDVVKQKAQWNGDDGCEHWHFCKTMRELGDIVVRADITPTVFHDNPFLPMPAYLEQVDKLIAQWED